MELSKRPIIAVVTALANGFAEKELLDGIISENKKKGYATVVFSNIYNMVQRDDELFSEQRIYDLLKSPDISGVILLCESFVEGSTRRRIASVLSRLNVPIVGVGARLDEFAGLDIPLLNTSDSDDIAELTSHLIEEHSFTDIALLTGMKEVEPSRLRADGFVKALEAHGIKPDTDKIYYGDFWFTSGEKLADRYISGELALPQAVICANDMMAYGMLRRFSEAHISVPEQVTVVSYEYSDNRIYYSPLLTSYRKNRIALGSAAARRLQCVISSAEIPEFVPPRGNFVFGSSCPCGVDKEQSLSELKEAQLRKNYSDLCLFSTMDQKLTLCRDMDEFISIIGDYQWMIRDKNSIYLCLYSDWNEAETDKSEVMRSVKILGGNAPFEMDHYDLRAFFERERNAAVCYFDPLFSGQRFFGYMAILYDSPKSYDDVYRHWLKSVSIGLEFLRLKNDIRYLISCQNVSEYRDTLTGMNNRKGLKRAFQAVRVHDNKRLYFVMLRIDLFPRQLNDEEIRRKTEATLGVSDAIGKFCGIHDISGRVSEDVFVCLVQSLAEPDVITDLLRAILLQQKEYTGYAGTSSFACCTVPCADLSFDELIARGTDLINDEHRRLSAQRGNRYYSDMAKVRDRVYSSTELTFEHDSENIYTDRIDFFRRNYKNCFGIAFHQDCINARLAKAKYYLVTTSLSIADISDKCGYLDYKYFQRQFVTNTGIPVLKYRNLIKG